MITVFRFPPIFHSIFFYQDLELIKKGAETDKESTLDGDEKKNPSKEKKKTEEPMNKKVKADKSSSKIIALIF